MSCIDTNYSTVETTVAPRGGTGILALIQTWSFRYASRRQLRHLDDHDLADIGITREQALNEAAKPFWVG